ncbi:conserved hypothetical protein [Ricinus communis]|uniref:Uncharacterized protein n=1 Tax=Ricinus communis TaxID=3988 RepID=B9S6P1_RICCO|nr:conserved hypothetical protein [Ricinus communis]
MASSRIITASFLLVSLLVLQFSEAEEMIAEVPVKEDANYKKGQISAEGPAEAAVPSAIVCLQGLMETFRCVLVMLTLLLVNTFTNVLKTIFIPLFINLSFLQRFKSGQEFFSVTIRFLFCLPLQCRGSTRLCCSHNQPPLHDS